MQPNLHLGNLQLYLRCSDNLYLWLVHLRLIYSFHDNPTQKSLNPPGPQPNRAHRFRLHRTPFLHGLNHPLGMLFHYPRNRIPPALQVCHNHNLNLLPFHWVHLHNPNRLCCLRLRLRTHPSKFHSHKNHHQTLLLSCNYKLFHPCTLKPHRRHIGHHCRGRMHTSLHNSHELLPQRHQHRLEILHHLGSQRQPLVRKPHQHQLVL